MTVSEIVTTVSSALACLGVAWGLIERVRGARAMDRATAADKQANEAKSQQAAHEEVIRAKDTVIQTIGTDRDEWKKRYGAVNDELTEYRKQVHDRNEKVNEQLMKLTADNADLKAKTDLTPLVHFADNQSAINDKVVCALDKILLSVDEILKRSHK